MKRYKFALLATLLTGSLGLNLSLASPAKAGWGVMNDVFGDVLGDLDPTNPDNSVSPLMNFEICNQSGHTIYYNVNTKSQTLKDGYCMEYSRYPIGTDISFDWSYRDGYQGKWYDLSHGKKYTFNKTSTGAGIDLYRS